MNKNSKIYVAGHTGLVGGAIVEALENAWYTSLLLRSRDQLDLLDQNAVHNFLQNEKPDYVILAAAKVWGIKANMTFGANFLYENLQIQNNIIWGAHLADIDNLLFLGSSCIYPRWCDQPMKEEYLLDGKPEPTNEGYALAKIAGIKLCGKIYDQFWRNYISCMPTNVYGPGDNFDLESSHVIPWLMRRMYEAKINNTPEVVIWWSGVSRREFLYVDDLADGCLWLMENYREKEFLNVWTWEDISIKELARTLKEITRYEWELVFDTTKPDWMPKKLLDVSKIHAAGWKHSTSFEDGLQKTYDYFLNNIAS